jgi:rod shape-determining protein MreD
MIAEGNANGWRIAVSMAAGMALAIVPMPRWLELFRPEFLLLIVIYWSLAAPRVAGMMFAWLAGLAIDIVHGVVLGQHALAFLFVSFVTHRIQLRMRIFPIWQQAFAVLLMLGLYEFVVFWIDGIIGKPVTTALRWIPIFTGALLWPFTVAVLDTWNRRRR